MIYTIKNKYIEAYISSYGAELISLKDNEGIERLHQKDKKTWDRQSPILFPTVSRFKDYVYDYKGKEYTMPMHGFFKDMDLVPVNVGKDFIEFSVKNDEKTLLMYPFYFSFNVKYTVFNSKLIVSFKVKNEDDKAMYHMLGGHPGFIIPLFDNETYDDYYLEFEKKETSDAMQVVDNYLANVYKRALTNENIINLKHSLFDPDAIVLTKLKSKYVILKSKKHNKAIKFYFSDFKILAIWSQMNDDANFVCLEPWNGIQKDFVKDIEQMGILKLNSKQTKKYNYIIEVI